VKGIYHFIISFWPMLIYKLIIFTGRVKDFQGRRGPKYRAILHFMSEMKWLI